MKKQVHKTDDGKAKARPGIKANSQIAHPILHLQRMVGNKAVTNLIQRHPEQAEQVRQLREDHSWSINWAHRRIDEIETRGD